MTFDPVAFGWGLGLVLSGWFGGMCVGVAFKTLGSIKP